MNPEIITAAASSPLGVLALMMLVLSSLALAYFKDAEAKIKRGVFVLLFLGRGGLRRGLAAATASGPETKVQAEPPSSRPPRRPPNRKSSRRVRRRARRRKPRLSPLAPSDRTASSGGEAWRPHRRWRRPERLTARHILADPVGVGAFRNDAAVGQDFMVTGNGGRSMFSTAMIKVERIKIESRVADNVRALAHLRGVSLSEAIDIAVREMMSPALTGDDRVEKLGLHTDADPDDPNGPPR